MIPRATVSCSLSLLIVVLATIVLHEAERRGQVAAIPGPKADRVSIAPRIVAPIPEPKPRSEPAKVPERAPVLVEDARRPGSPFARAEVGETLADVARRVYGAKVDVDAFWSLNRDQVAERDAPLRAGLLLRTPEL